MPCNIKSCLSHQYVHLLMVLFMTFYKKKQLNGYDRLEKES